MVGYKWLRGPISLSKLTGPALLALAVIVANCGWLHWHVLIHPFKWFFEHHTITVLMLEQISYVAPASPRILTLCRVS